MAWADTEEAGSAPWRVAAAAAAGRARTASAVHAKVVEAAVSAAVSAALAAVAPYPARAASRPPKPSQAPQLLAIEDQVALSSSTKSAPLSPPPGVWHSTCTATTRARSRSRSSGGGSSSPRPRARLRSRSRSRSSRLPDARKKERKSKKDYKDQKDKGLPQGWEGARPSCWPQFQRRSRRTRPRRTRKGVAVLPWWTEAGGGPIHPHVRRRGGHGGDV